MTRTRIGGVDHHSEEAGADESVLLHGGFCSLESLRAPGEALASDHHVLAVARTLT